MARGPSEPYGLVVMTSPPCPGCRRVRVLRPLHWWLRLAAVLAILVGSIVALLALISGGVAVSSLGSPFASARALETQGASVLTIAVTGLVVVSLVKAERSLRRYLESFRFPPPEGTFAYRLQPGDPRCSAHRA